MSLFKKFFSKTEVRPQEQAVILHLDGKKLDNETYKKYDLATLEDSIDKVLKEKIWASMMATNSTTKRWLSIYNGPDAEKIFSAIEYIVKEYPLCKKARVEIRRGGPGSPSREVLMP